MSRILVPIDILQGDAIAPGLIELLGSLDVTLLGIERIPEQTPADQARNQFEERAVDALEDVAAQFRSAGGKADHRLVFTHDREKSIDRIADEIDARARVVPGSIGEVVRLLVPLSGEISTEKLIGFVADLIGERPIGVTLVVAGSEPELSDRAERAVARLGEAGIDTRVVESDESPFDALMAAVPGHDVIVMGERAPSLNSLLFGKEPEQVAKASVGPVIVVREDGETQ